VTENGVMGLWACCSLLNRIGKRYLYLLKYFSRPGSSSIRSDDHEAERKQSKSSRATRATAVFLRGIGLQIFSALFYDRSSLELAKIAIHKNISISIFQLAVRSIPLAAAFALIGLNARGSLVPDFNSWPSFMRCSCKPP
jgi:hypothetical protein